MHSVLSSNSLQNSANNNESSSQVRPTIVILGCKCNIHTYIIACSSGCNLDVSISNVQIISLYFVLVLVLGFPFPRFCVAMFATVPGIYSHGEITIKTPPFYFLSNSFLYSSAVRFCAFFIFGSFASSSSCSFQYSKSAEISSGLIPFLTAVPKSSAARSLSY